MFFSSKSISFIKILILCFRLAEDLDVAVTALQMYVNEVITAHNEKRVIEEGEFSYEEGTIYHTSRNGTVKSATSPTDILTLLDVQVSVAHFEDALTRAKPSVPPNELARYESFQKWIFIFCKI